MEPRLGRPRTSTAVFRSVSLDSQVDRGFQHPFQSKSCLLHPQLAPSGEKNAQLQMHLKVIFDSVKQLYTEYLQDFISRKKTRLNSKKPYEYQQRYHLSVDHKFRKKLRKNFKVLIDTELSDRLIPQFRQKVSEFVDGLQRELQSLRGKSRLLRVIMLTQAYYTLANAADQLEKIAAPIFRGDLSCKDLNKEIFQEKIMVGSSELLEYAQEEFRHEAAHQLLQIEQKLLTHSDFSESDYSSDEKQCLHKMEVDELVQYINQNELKRSKKKNKKKNQGKDEEDLEVEAFRERLKNFACVSEKLKPLISEEYLRSLRILVNKKR